MIELHLLGAGGAVPTPTHGPAAYWLVVDGEGFLLDPGPGALVRLVRQPGAPDDVDDIDNVLVSHLHLDHTADIAPLLFAAHSVLARNPRPLRICGPPGLARYLDRLRDLYGSWLTPRAREVVTTELAPGDVVPAGRGGGRLTPFAVDHEETRFGAACFGYRIEDAAGRCLVFSGDTGPCAELTAATRGTDALVVECSTPDDLACPGHMCPARIVALCREARPGRVVLTHLYPLIANRDAAGAVTRGSGIACVEARDGDVVRIAAEASVGEEVPR